MFCPSWCYFFVILGLCREEREERMKEETEERVARVPGGRDGKKQHSLQPRENFSFMLNWAIE